MRKYRVCARDLARILICSTFLATPALVQAQTYFPAPELAGQVQPTRSHHGWGLHSRGDAIPRTYSYYYDTWFNQPCHFRVIGPDGKISWRKTVRGLPLGTPWPSYGAVGMP